jgi:hypothetical protein
VRVPFRIGTMIEVPRAALTADRSRARPDFFSFGTNDLTQMTYALSRDDAARFLPSYLETGILADDPFTSIDEEGIGVLISLAAEKGRDAPRLKLGCAASTAAIRRACASALRVASTTSRARRSACRSRGSPPRRRRSRGDRMKRSGGGARARVRRPLRRRPAAARAPESGAIAWRPSVALALRHRVEGFYLRLAHRRFDTLETYNDFIMRDHFAVARPVLRLLRRPRRDLAHAQFDRSRPTEVEVLEFLFEDAKTAQVLVRFRGDDGRRCAPARSSSCAPTAGRSRGHLVGPARQALNPAAK